MAGTVGETEVMEAAVTAGTETAMNLEAVLVRLREDYKDVPLYLAFFTYSLEQAQTEGELYSALTAYCTLPFDPLEKLAQVKA